jgi:hypothetical protein
MHPFIKHLIVTNRKFSILLRCSLALSKLLNKYLYLNKADCDSNGSNSKPGEFCLILRAIKRPLTF